MDTVQKPSPLTGLLIGLLLTAPLMALFYLGNVLVGLPLVPLDFFDFLVPIIPGELITIVIDAMVTSIIAAGQGQNVDTLAKTIEQGMGYGMFWAVAAIIATIVFVVARNMNATTALRVSAGVGIALGVVFGAISATSNFLEVSPVVAFLWTALLFAGWGLALGWVYRDLSALPTAGDKASDEQVGRREFLVRVGGATATLTVVGAGLGLALGGEDDALTGTTNTVGGGVEAPDLTEAGEGAIEVADGRLPNADAVVQPAPGMRPEYTPVEEHYRIDIASRPIEIDLATWTLPFSGLVADRAFTMDELRNDFQSLDQYVTLQCISNRIGGNLISTTKWTGVPVRDVLNELEIEEGGAWLKIDGGDDFFEYVSIEMIMNDERIMFTYDWDDEPLPTRNGFPLRIYIPDLYGMKQPKWIQNIEVVESDERGYWVRRGWSATAVMMTTSVVDTVATRDFYADEEGAVRVPIGGYAISGAREISKVEISINDGEWIEADLRDPISDTTWVFWRYDWTFEEGEHTFAVRCYDGDGDLQPTRERGVRPDGASGIDTAEAALPDPETALEGLLG
ncbi:MAG: molybdopterin-dependent oxidoreductase [Chloroflexota bacterium]